VGSGPCGSSWIGRRFQWHQTFWRAKLSFFLKKIVFGAYFIIPHLVQRNSKSKCPNLSQERRSFQSGRISKRPKNPYFIAIKCVCLTYCYLVATTLIAGLSKEEA
jgi:hypothetical protein